MTSLGALTVEQLADGICLRAGRIAAAQAELLTWIAEFDRREGWAGPGLLSCAHWLSWRIGLSLGTAREQVRVARRLPELPELANAFADGRVSYSKVRAIARVAEPDDGIDWVALGRSSSAAQLERLVRGVSRARATEDAQRDPDAAAWRLRTRVRYDEHGGFVLTISGPAQLLPTIRAGLDAKKHQLQRVRDHSSPASPSEPAPPPPPRQPTPAPLPSSQEPPGLTSPDRRPAESAAPAVSADPNEQVRTEQTAATDAGIVPDPQPPARRRTLTSVPAAPPTPDPTAEPETVTDADALLALAIDALDTERTGRPDLTRRRRPYLTVRIDPISGWARQGDGELLPPTSLRAALKTLPGRGSVLRLRPATAADLRRTDLGRAARQISPALRELLGTLDGERCRFPGCTRQHDLHAHHVQFWRDGGPTDLANLVLVCSRHHTLIHTQGFALVLHPDRRLDVTTADGTPVLHHPDQPWGNPIDLATTCGQHVSAETLPPDHTDGRLDLGYAVTVLMTQAA